MSAYAKELFGWLMVLTFAVEVVIGLAGLLS